MDNLKCNRLNCRKVLSEKAVVVCSCDCFGHFDVLRVCAVVDNLYDKQPKHARLYLHIFITMMQARIYSAVWGLPRCDARTTDIVLSSRVCQWAIQRIKIMSRYWENSFCCVALLTFMEPVILPWLSRAFFDGAPSAYWQSFSIQGRCSRAYNFHQHIYEC